MAQALLLAFLLCARVAMWQPGHTCTYLSQCYHRVAKTQMLAAAVSECHLPMTLALLLVHCQAPVSACCDTGKLVCTCAASRCHHLVLWPCLLACTHYTLASPPAGTGTPVHGSKSPTAAASAHTCVLSQCHLLVTKIDLFVCLPCPHVSSSSAYMPVCMSAVSHSQVTTL